MKRFSLRGAAALAILTLAIAGCQNGGSGDGSVDSLESIDASSPSMDMTMPSGSDMNMGSEEPSPSGS
jgi:hypothetical protein